MKNHFIKIAAIVLLIGVLAAGTYALLSGDNGPATATRGIDQPLISTGASSGSAQQATLSMKGWTYIVSPSALQVGVPVEMTVDLSTVTGCMRDVVISEFGVRTYVSAGNNVIRFTPTKTGTFPIVCSMNMGRGQFTVVGESTATVSSSTTVTSPSSASGSLASTPPVGAGCGMGTGGGGTGGCGCH